MIIRSILVFFLILFSFKLLHADLKDKAFVIDVEVWAVEFIDDGCFVELSEYEEIDGDFFSSETFRPEDVFTHSVLVNKLRDCRRINDTGTYYGLVKKSEEGYWIDL